MSFTIENYFRKIKRVRITFLNGKFEVNWPIGTDINLNDRESKVHSALKRCYASNPSFKLENMIVKTNIQVSRIDKFDDEIDLYWEAPKTICIDVQQGGIFAVGIRFNFLGHALLPRTHLKE